METKHLEVGDCVSLANNTSIVCGIIKSKAADGLFFVEWDDALYYPAKNPILCGFYPPDWLDKVTRD